MDYLSPDFVPIFKRRTEMLQRLRADPSQVPLILQHYKANPIAMVCDWGMTTDPRNIERGLPALVPFVPFPKQIEWMQWLLDRWRNGEGGLTEKTRDMGCSVCAMSLFSAIAVTHRDFVAGVGSRKEMLVDAIGNPSTLFFKARTFLRYLPEEFRGGWRESDKLRNSHMKISIPNTESVIIGEAGDDIGRGGRTSVYLVDEKAHLRNQDSVEMSLSQTTRCQIDLSSVKGMANNFAEKRHSGRVPVFTFHWRDDPRKDDAWYARECARLPAVIVAQELDINYSAAQENIVIPSDWVQAAIDAHLVIPALAASGASDRLGGLDVADEGEDLNAFASRLGVVLTYSEDWSGKASDIFATTAQAVQICDTLGLDKFRYDADGIGAGVRGDARVINTSRKNKIEVEEHRGSGAVVNKDDFAIDPDHANGHKGRTNDDFFENYKAQAWWSLRRRFERTYGWVRNGRECDPADCISISSSIKELGKLQQELSQAKYKASNSGKIMIEKKPKGTKSPNRADSVVIAYAPIEMGGRSFGMLL